MKALFAVIVAAFVLGACHTMQTATPASAEAMEYRELQGELYQQQTDIAITGQKIENQGRGLVENLTRLEEAIAASPDAGETDRIYWLSQVQTARVDAEVHQTDIEDLNRQLAAERETVKKKDHKFNNYEIEMVKMLSDKDAENAQLKEENEAVKGQRNTFLAILITAGVVVVLFIVFKVLRAIKIIPI